MGPSRDPHEAHWRVFADGVRALQCAPHHGHQLLANQPAGWRDKKDGVATGAHACDTPSHHIHLHNVSAADLAGPEEPAIPGITRPAEAEDLDRVISGQAALLQGSSVVIDGHVPCPLLGHVLIPIGLQPIIEGLGGRMPVALHDALVPRRGAGFDVDLKLDWVCNASSHVNKAVVRDADGATRG